MKGLAWLAALGLASCNAAAPPPPPARPVLSALAEQESADQLTLAGVVAARTQADLAFQTLGRLISRPVNVGDEVQKGQTLATIDAIQLRFAELSAEADKASSEAQLANAVGVAERQSQLLKTGASSQAQADEASQALATARAAAAKADAAVAKAKEQLGYGTLKAEFAGVVTATGAEVGQTVSPGQAVVTVADPAQRDAVVDAPEQALAAFPLGARVETFAEIEPRLRAEGTVREIAPQADAATRTRRIKIGLEKPPTGYRLGSTIRARPLGAGKTVVRLPASAILLRDGKPFVWVVDEQAWTVKTKAVTLADAGADPVEVTGGLEPAMRVVTAGVHSLAEGQPVKPQPRAEP